MQTRPVHTGLVQVVRQLYHRLHLHVGLEDAAADLGLVVGLLRLGLDSCLHPALGDVRGDGPQMVRHRPTVLQLLAQCTMECGFSEHQ